MIMIRLGTFGRGAGVCHHTPRRFSAPIARQYGQCAGAQRMVLCIQSLIGKLTGPNPEMLICNGREKSDDIPSPQRPAYQVSWQNSGVLSGESGGLGY